MCKYSVRVITKSEEWETIEGEWNALLTRSNNNIFLTYEWLKTWWNIFGNGELYIILIEHNKKIISILPLYVRKIGLIKILRFIGAGVSDYGCFIIDKAYDAVKIYNIAFNFFCTKPLWDIIDLQQISEETSLYHYLSNMNIFTNNKRFDVKLYEQGKCFYIPKSEGSFTQNFNKSFCFKMQKREKNLMRLGDVAYNGVENINKEILQRFFQMHIEKWYKSGKVSDFSFCRYREFHSEIIKKFAQNSWLSFSTLKLHDNYIAFIYAFLYNNKIYIYIKTYDPNLAKYSPGHLVTLHYLNLMQNSKITEVDLLRGEEKYKLNWTKQYRVNYRFIVYKKSVNGMLYKFYIMLMDRLYKTKRFRGLTRYIYKVLRQCKLLFQRRGW